ncbi:MAG: PQQ-dependent sugar dehydrogenase [Gammaproteobacteria bacterium]
MQTSILFRISLGLVVFCGAVAAEKPVNWQELPAPYATRSVARPPFLVPRPAGARLTLPPGFHAEEFHRGIDAPRYMLLSPGGEVLVSDMDAGVVYVLEGKVARALIGSLDRPYGLAWHKDWLYIAEASSVKRYRYDPQERRLGLPGEEVIPLHRVSGGHATRTLLFDTQGEKLYLAIGSASNVDLGEPPIRAAINRYNPDGSGHEVFASGLRNPVGLRWYPGSSSLWVTSVERDGLGDDLPPDFLTEVKPGGFYGWPYAYIGPHEDPRHRGTAPDQVRRTRYPSVLLGAHVASLDFIFYTGEQFPERYRGGCFAALHGSWNRSRLSGYKLVFVPFKNGTASAGPEDFLTGWLPAPESPKVWGRPVGLLELKDGSILISDDGGGRIWRVYYRP